MNKIKRILSLMLAMVFLTSVPVQAKVFGKMDHPSEMGDVKISKEFTEMKDGVYKVDVRIEAKDVLKEIKSIGEAPKHSDQIQSTIISVDTSGSFSGQPSDEARASLKTFCRELFQMGDYIRIMVMGPDGTAITPFLGADRADEVYRAIEQELVVGKHGSSGRLDYGKAFTELRSYDRQLLKPAKKRVLFLFDGDSFYGSTGHTSDADIKSDANRDGIDIYSIFFGSGSKDNVRATATRPEFFFDSTTEGISRAYQLVKETIISTMKIEQPGLSDATLYIPLDYGFEYTGESSTTDGTVKYVNDVGKGMGAMKWDIGSLTKEVYGVDKVKYAEMTYYVKINKDLVNSDTYTPIDSTMVLNNNGVTTQYNSNDLNFLRTIINLEKRVAELEAEVERLNKEIAELNRQIKILNWDKERLQKQVNYLNDRLKEKQEELRILSVKYENLKTQNRDLTYKNTVLENNVERLTKRVSKLEKDLEGANTTILFQEAEIKRLNRAIKDKDFEISSLKDKIQELNNKILDKETDINLLKMENQRKDIEIEGLKQNIIDKEAKISDLEHEIELLNIDKKANKEEIERLKDTIAELKSDIRDYRNDIRRLEDDTQKNKEEIARLREIEKENEQRKIQIASLESKIKDLERDKLDLERQLADAELKLKEMELQAKDNKDKMENLENDLERERDLRRADTRRHEENYRAARDEVVYQKRLRDWEGFAMQKERDNDKLVMHYQDTIDKSALAMLINNVVNETANALSTTSGVVDYTFKIGSTTYTYRDHNGAVSIVGMEAAPFIENSRTYIPLRYVANAVGADVSWNDSNKTASFSKDGLNAYVQLNNKMVRLSNGSTVTMDVMPKVIKNRIFIPVRFVADIFGQNSVTWDGATQSVIVKR